MIDKKLGVIVGRFQTSKLTEGHRELIETVLKKHQTVIIFLGCNHKTKTKREPLDFITRKMMLESEFKTHSNRMIILPQMDNRSDVIWSNNLDRKISEISNKGAILYGSRDSFIPHYHGKHKTIELETVKKVSATEIRNDIANKPIDDVLFRTGVIYSKMNDYARTLMCVDIAPINKNQVLLAKKEGEKEYRFIGGHVDVTDNNAKAAAKRELREETGGNADFGDFRLIGEAKIDDWRYRKDDDKIFTLLFECKFVMGRIEPSDDIVHLEWIDIDKLEKTPFVPEHLELKEIFIDGRSKKQQ